MEKAKCCACCGNPLRFPYDCDEICKICGWQDDDIQNDDPDFEGGANDMSLNQAKMAYAQGRKVL